MNTKATGSREEKRQSVKHSEAPNESRISGKGIRHRFTFPQINVPPGSQDNIDVILPDHGSVKAWVRILRAKHVAWLPGTTQEVLERFERDGIVTIGDLADVDPVQLSMSSGVAENLIDDLRSTVRFLTVPGMERRSASLLVGLGIRDWHQFFTPGEQELAAALNKLDADRHGEDKLFSYNECVIERWRVLAREFGAGNRQDEV